MLQNTVKKTWGDCDGSGTCISRPVACLTLYDPVCGCDGNTYSNDCYAAANGVNVAYKGECEPIITTSPTTEITLFSDLLAVFSIAILTGAYMIHRCRKQ